MHRNLGYRVHKKRIGISICYRITCCACALEITGWKNFRGKPKLDEAGTQALVLDLLVHHWSVNSLLRRTFSAGPKGMHLGKRQLYKLQIISVVWWYRIWISSFFLKEQHSLFLLSKKVNSSSPMHVSKCVMLPNTRLWINDIKFEIASYFVIVL